MAGLGRGSASSFGAAAKATQLVGFTTVLLLVVLLCSAPLADAAGFAVGDAKGWTFNTAGWSNGKAFRAGDVLTFRYSPVAHNLVVVDKAGFDSCTAGRGSKVFTSGNDRVTLPRGTSYYICTVPGHCGAGMKLAVTAN